MKLFTWDLHGTLEYGNDRVVIDIGNQVLADHGYAQRFTYADSRALYGRPWTEYFRWLLGGGDDDRDALLRNACTAIADKYPERYLRQIRPTPHAHAVLRAITDARHDQILISNARDKTLRMFIHALGYADFFPEERAIAVGDREPGRRAKEDALSGYLRNRDGYDELVIIGDTAHDMNLASVAGGTTYLFARPGTRFPDDCPADHQIRDLRHLLARL